MSANPILRIALTPGEPAGIGPDLTIKLAQQDHPYELIAVCDPEMLAERAETLGLRIKIDLFDAGLPPAPSRAGHIRVLPTKLTERVVPGKLNPANAAYVVETLKLATDQCLAKSVAAIVTGPVQKSVINDAGISFSGHTEFFADYAGTPKVVMMLATEGLRVALATTHLPLRQVPDAITRESLAEVITVLLADMRSKFDIPQPRILVCGLNPHAGEGGHLGRDEIDTIIPVIEDFNRRGANLVGPLPADTLFTPHRLAKADAVLAMYHDQGLPVLKHKGFGNAINITLGLPFIRTSVDHGTALDLAGKGTANASSLFVAANYAFRLASPGQR